MRKKHGSSHQAEAHPRTRVLIAVSCNNSLIVNKIIAAKGKTGLLNFAMLNRSSLPEETTDFITKHDFNINVNELLPPETHKLPGKSKAILRPAGVKYIWSRNGYIYANLDEQSLVYTINALDDVDKILIYSRVYCNV